MTLKPLSPDLTCRCGPHSYLTDIRHLAATRHIVPLAVLVRRHAVLLLPGSGAGLWLAGPPRRELAGSPRDFRPAELAAGLGEGRPVGEGEGAFGGPGDVKLERSVTRLNCLELTGRQVPASTGQDRQE